MPKYELIEDDRLFDYRGYRGSRIRALRDIPEHGVRAGDKGGYIDSHDNLSHEGAAWVGGHAAALDNSRVEGNAIAKNNSRLRGNAVLGGNSVLYASAEASDFAIIRGNSRIGSHAKIKGQAVIDGDIDLKQTHTIDGDQVIRSQEALPWSLNMASLDDPHFLPRMHEAVQLDPAFHRLMATIGAHTPEERREAVDLMFQGTKTSRESLLTFAQELGGTFHTNTYEALTDVKAMQKFSASNNMNLQDNFTNYRALSWILDRDAVTLENDKLNAAIFRAVVPDPETGKNKEYYQAGLAQSVTPELATLAPIQMRLFVGDHVYGDFNSAHMAAEELVASFNNEDRQPHHSNGSNKPLEAHPDISRLPMLGGARDMPLGVGRPYYAMRLDLQRLDTPENPEARRLGLNVAVGHSVVEVKAWDRTTNYDLRKVAEGSNYHRSLIDAHRQAESVYGSIEDLQSRLQSEIVMKDTAVYEALSLKDEDQSPRAQRLRAERARLDPLNISVIAKTERVEAPLAPPKPSQQGITFDQIKQSLKPLEWQNSLDPWDSTRFTDFIMEADTKSLNVNYKIERQEEGNWSFYVEAISDGEVSNGRSKSLPHLLERQDFFASAEAAMDGVERHRARTIAAELGVSDDASLKLQVDSPAAAKAHQAPNTLAVAWHKRTADGGTFLAGSLALADDGRVRSMTFPGNYSQAEDALTAAKVEIQSQMLTASGPVIDMPRQEASSKTRAPELTI